MKVFALWYGGASYTTPDVSPETVEVFDSIQDAKESLMERYISGWRGADFTYVNGTKETVACPGVDGTSEMQLFFYDPTDPDVTDPYPDRLASFGPRGGVRVTRC